MLLWHFERALSNSQDRYVQFVCPHQYLALFSKLSFADGFHIDLTQYLSNICFALCSKQLSFTDRFHFDLTPHLSNICLFFKGIRFPDRDTVDYVFRMCCALHNLLLIDDGLDEKWDADEFDPAEYDDMPLRRLQDMDAEAVLREQQGMFGEEAELHANVQVDVEEEPSFDEFRAALIEHFNYRWKLPRDHPDAIKWPRRNGAPDSHVSDDHDQKEE